MIPGSGRSPGKGNNKLLQCSCLQNFQGQRSLAGYSHTEGYTESDTTEQVNSNLNTPKIQGCELGGEWCCAHTLPLDWPPPQEHTGLGMVDLWRALHCGRVSPTRMTGRVEVSQEGCTWVSGQPSSGPHPGLSLTTDLSSQEDPAPEKQWLQTLPGRVRRPELCPPAASSTRGSPKVP